MGQSFFQKLMGGLAKFANPEHLQNAAVSLNQKQLLSQHRYLVQWLH